MLDAHLRPLIDPPLNAAGRWLAKIGIGADAITLSGFIAGIGAAIVIANGAFIVGAVLIALNRIADGLDGAVARATTKTDRGGYLDIVFDFIFYGAVPLGFVLADPAANAIAGAVLLFVFYANGASFLAFAIMNKSAPPTKCDTPMTCSVLKYLSANGPTISGVIMEPIGIQP